MKEYSKEREAFKLLREKCTEEMKREYECAVKILLEKYNTTIYENRFTVGGALEVFTCALLRSVLIVNCTLISQNRVISNFHVVVVCLLKARLRAEQLT